MSRISANLATAIAFGLIMALLGLVGIWQAVQYASVRRERGNCAFAVFLLAVLDFVLLLTYASALDLEAYRASNTMNKDLQHEQIPANHLEITTSLPLPDTGPKCYRDHPFYLVVSSPKSPHPEMLSYWDIPTPPYGLTDARVSIFDVEVS
jgi:hypothetical protein